MMNYCQNMLPQSMDRLNTLK